MDAELKQDFTESFNPATGELLVSSKLHSVEELKNIISGAKKAQVNWSGTQIDFRIEKIIKIRKYLIDKIEEISGTISRNNGKTKLDALVTEIFPAALAVSYYCKNAKKFLKDKRLKAGSIVVVNKRSRIVRVPYGAVGIISPWNYPFSIAFSEVVMGLLAGNSVILKTASETQMVGLLLKEAFDYAGLPDGIFNYINMPGKIAGDAFLENGIDKLFFTGSVPVGKYLMKKASETLTPLCLELGGNDAMIVCADADPYRAAMGAVWAGFSNSGQSCGGVERIYVHENIYDEFTAILNEAVSNLRLAPGIDMDSDMGCMTTGRQIKTVNIHIEDALKKGAIISAKSKVPDETKYKNFIPAMVVTDVNHDMLLMRDETFGPVVGVMKVKSDDEAVRLANDSYLGLTGSVWSNDWKKAVKIGRRIKAGAITINDHLMSHGLAETSWGGFKESGIGRTHGELGFSEMTQPQMIIIDIMPGLKKNMWWHPYSKNIYEGMKGLLHMLYGNGAYDRIAGAEKLLKIIPRMFRK